MKIESTGFTEEDLKAFLQESVAFERTRAKDDLMFADRLEAASARLTMEENYLIQKLARTALKTHSVHSCEAT